MFNVIQYMNNKENPIQCIDSTLSTRQQVLKPNNKFQNHQLNKTENVIFGYVTVV